MVNRGDEDAQVYRLTPEKQEREKGDERTEKSCDYCGKIGLHPPGRNCPA